MFCEYCGHKNPDEALTCGACGLSPSLQRNASAAPPPMPGAPAYQSSARLPPLPAASVPNYLVWSILATLCCCVPGGIVAIVYSSQVNSKLAAGDHFGAQAASDNARLWCWISFGVGLVVGLLSVVAGALDGNNQPY